MPDLNRLYDQLRRQEGERLFPYTDTVGKITIGCGHNLTDCGITKGTSQYMLMEDVGIVYKQCSYLPWFGLLDDVRQNVILNLVFNIGLNSLLTFKNMIAAIKVHDWHAAAQQMINSKWAQQVGKSRSVELATMMESGEWP